MAQGLDTVDWGRLQHAYGPATDLPTLIRALTDGDHVAADAAIAQLSHTICHQGTVYSASAPAVPFLVDALSTMTPDNQAHALDLLGALAQGAGYYDVHRHLPIVARTVRPGRTDDLDATVATERSVVGATTLAVFAHWDAIERFLDAEDRRLRFAALQVLAALGQNDASDPAHPDQAAPYLGIRPAGTAKGDWAARLCRWVEPRLAGTDDPLDRAAYLRALSLVGVHDHAALQLGAAASASALEQYVIVRSCAARDLTLSTALPDAFAPAIAGLVDRVDALRAVNQLGVWPWADEFEPGLLQLFDRLPDHALDTVAPACARLIAEARMLIFHFDTVLSLVLGHPIPRIPDDPCTLSDGRRVIAAMFLARPPHDRERSWFWHPKNGNAAAACARARVPHDRAVWLRWLGLPDDTERRTGRWWKVLLGR